MFTLGTSTNPPTYKHNGLLIEFDNRNEKLFIRDKEGVEETINLYSFDEIFDDLCYDNTKVIKGTIWINTDYVPLNNGWYMKQSDWEHKVKNKTLKVPVLALIEMAYERR